MTEPIDYAALSTKEEKAAAIAAATTELELDDMWDAFEAQRHSREGLLYADLLARKVELGMALPDDDQELLTNAAAKRAHGASLPPITGKLGG